MMLPDILAGIINTNPLPKPTGGASVGRIQIILSIVFAITGAIALLIITIAGFKFVVSRGDPQAVAGARSAIVYAVVGLVVSVTSFTIVTFVLNGLF